MISHNRPSTSSSPDLDISQDGSEQYQCQIDPQDPVGQDSEGLSISDDDMVGSSQQEEDSGDEQDDSERCHMYYCTNCTGRLYDDLCDECGHHAQDNEDLFGQQSTFFYPGSSTASNQQIVLAWDERMELHEEGKPNPHPERPDRIRAVVARLLASGISGRCRRVPCREATVAELSAVHTPELVKFVESTSGSCEPSSRPQTQLMTSDSYANEHTYMCARLAAGSAAEVASMVARGEAPHGAAIVRPPGHHAESGMAMGFCFFNNAAVAARAAQAAGAQRVLILDWDIHHGNGTQHIFDDDRSVMYMSLHRYDHGAFYPGTGGVEEVGVGNGEGYTVNIPWNAKDMGNGDYITAFHQVLMPVAYEYNPDLIIVSAGFDAAEGDPIGECRLTPECFAHMTAMLQSVAPLVLLLEGGYNLRSTATSTEACLRVLLGERPPCLPGARYPSPFGWQSIQAAIQVQASYWKSLQPTCNSLAVQRMQAAAALRRAAGGGTSVSDGSNGDRCHYSAHTNNGYAEQDGGEGDEDDGGGEGEDDDEQPAKRQATERNLVAGESSRHQQPRRHRLHHLSRKRQVLLAIHRSAMQAYWRKHK